MKLSILLIYFIISFSECRRRLYHRHPGYRHARTTANAPQAKIYAINMTAKVGESVILNCAINSSFNPGAIWTQAKIGNVLTFNTNRITVDPRFEIIQHSIHKEDELVLSDPNLIVSKQAHANDVVFYNLKIDNVQLYDENEYVCQNSITKSDEDEPLVHSLIYLYVTKSPNFVESQTSESNIAGVENGEVMLECTATGKPVPKIRWYQIDENIGTITDLNHESTSLSIRNLSKYEKNKYECVASNGILPSVSKKFTLTVYFAPVISIIQPHLSRSSTNSVVLGCVVDSNPQGTTTWYKFLDNVSQYLPIDELDLKYHRNNIKHSNHSISYLKITNFTSSDLAQFKCVANNVIGKSEKVVDLNEYKELLFKPKKNKIKIFKSDQEKMDAYEQYSIRQKGDGRYEMRKIGLADSNSNQSYFSTRFNKNSLILDNLENTSNTKMSYFLNLILLILTAFKCNRV